MSSLIGTVFWKCEDSTCYGYVDEREWNNINITSKKEHNQFNPFNLLPTYYEMWKIFLESLYMFSLSIIINLKHRMDITYRDCLVSFSSLITWLFATHRYIYITYIYIFGLYAAHGTIGLCSPNSCLF